MIRLWIFLILFLYQDVCTAKKLGAQCSGTNHTSMHTSDSKAKKETLLVRDRGMMPVKDAELGFSLFVTVHNKGPGPVQIMTRPVQCCEVITSSLTDCKSIKLMGGFMGTLRKGDYINATWTYPTMYEYNRRGECVLDLWWRDQYNSTDSKRFTIPFDTYVIHTIPWYMLDYKKATILLNKRCDSPDLDALDNCEPVDCHMKYDGNKNYFSWSELLCVASPTCYADPEKDVPDVAYSPSCNQCFDLDTPIMEEDMGFLLRPTVNMDVFETMAKKKVTEHYSLRCHHGYMDPESNWCVCEPGWSSSPVPEDFSPQRTLFTHMCTIYREACLYDILYQFIFTAIDVAHREGFYLIELSYLLAFLMVLLACLLDFCLSEGKRRPIPEICEDTSEEDAHFESDCTEIICTSSENWSGEVSDFHFTESSSSHNVPVSSRRVTWANNQSQTGIRNQQENSVQNVEILYPAKSCLKRPSSTIVYTMSSSKVSDGSSPDKDKMFETHFRLLIMLMLRKQPSTAAREHIEWIFENCPPYQRSLVLRFMRSFGMEVDKEGNLRGFRPRCRTIRSDSRKHNKMRKCHLRPKKMARVYQYRKEKRWQDRGSALSLAKPSCDGSRGEPEGSSDIDRNITIFPDYGDILRSVLPQCLEAPPRPETLVVRVPSPQTSDQEVEEQDKLPECSPLSNASSQMDISSKEVTDMLKKASDLQGLALCHKRPSMTSDFSVYMKYLRNIDKMRKSYSNFIEEIPRPVTSSSSNETSLCFRKTTIDLIHKKITAKVMQKLALLEERYRGILSNKNQWELRSLTTQNVAGIVQQQSSELVLPEEEKAFLRFFKNLVHFLFLMSCKRETMVKIMTTFGCSRHRTDRRLHPLVCLFLCYLQPMLLRFWKIVELERLLLEYFVVEYPQHTCLNFLTNLKKTTKFRICLYLHIFKILGMITSMEGVMEPNRKKFLLHLNVLERDLARFFKDMEKFQELQKEVRPSYSLAAGFLSILEVLHYFMVQSLYKMCLVHAEKPVTLEAQQDREKAEGD